MLVLVGNWWTFVLRGVLAILFGALAILIPRLALVTLIYLFGLYAIFEGVFNVVAAFSHRHPAQPWWALLAEGLLSMAAGLLAFFIPGLTALVLLYLIAGWAIATGILEIAAAIRLRRQLTGEWVLAVAGVLSVLVGLFLFVFPAPGALAVVIWIGIYAVVFGLLLVALGLRLRRWVHRLEADGHGYPAVGH